MVRDQSQPETCAALMAMRPAPYDIIFRLQPIHENLLEPEEERHNSTFEEHPSSLEPIGHPSTSIET